MTTLISLGSDCCVSYQLEKYGYRTAAYPFDWIRSSLQNCIQLIEYNFVNFLDVTDIYYTRISENYKFLIDTNEANKEVSRGFIYKSKLYKDLEFCHDFTDEFRSGLEDIQKKYHRRITRLYDLLEKDKDNIAFIHYSAKEIPMYVLQRWNQNIKKPLFIISPIKYAKDQLGYITFIHDTSSYDSWQRNNFDWTNLFKMIQIQKRSAK
jgi:hypothetical protein